MAHELHKGSHRRDNIASQIRHMRSMEGKRVETKRDADRYAIILGGIQHLFEYARSLGTGRDNVILDIGAGNTVGIAEISRSSLGKDLSFKATVLKHDDDIDKNLGARNVYHTPVETLRKISDGSIACILGLYSIAYSSEPILAIKNIDRVLMPGGVIKATFQLPGTPSLVDMQESSAFEAELEELGYDIALKNRGESTVIVAIKPGNKSSMTAQDLLDTDENSAVEQANRIKDENTSRIES